MLIDHYAISIVKSRPVSLSLLIEVLPVQVVELLHALCVILCLFFEGQKIFLKYSLLVQNDPGRLFLRFQNSRPF